MHISSRFVTTLCGVALLVASAGSSVVAQNTRGYERQDANIRLTRTYHRIMSMLNKDDKAALKKAQHAWKIMRNADCKWAFADVRDCLIGRTDHRIKELRESYFTTKDGNYVSLVGLDRT